MVVGRRWIVRGRLASDVVGVEKEAREEGCGQQERAPGEGEGGSAKCQGKSLQNVGRGKDQSECVRLVLSESRRLSLIPARERCKDGYPHRRRVAVV